MRSNTGTYTVIATALHVVPARYVVVAEDGTVESVQSEAPDVEEVAAHIWSLSHGLVELYLRNSAGLTDPPEARLEYSYDPFIGTAKGRTFKIGTKVRF